MQRVPPWAVFAELADISRGLEDIQERLEQDADDEAVLKDFRDLVRRLEWLCRLWLEENRA
jgi:hypothetical protein